MTTQYFWMFLIFIGLEPSRYAVADVVTVTTNHDLFVVRQHFVTQSSYKAAVYEHAVILPIPFMRKSRKEALKLMEKNLDIYEDQVVSASLQGADIIVFPEDGVYGPIFTRDTIEPFLEYIPDPRVDRWNPCLESSKYCNTDVQYRLSCLARYNSIYMVVNMGDRQPCNHTDPDCPDDGRFQFNTNVVYDPDGMLIARYHKQNLFKESQFNTPPQIEQIFFDTPFGRFGTFTCFDILFRAPAVDLIEKHHIDSVVFPTAWMDALPLLAAIQYHSAFAVMMKVNLLAANLHIPILRFGGSGIYTPSGPEVFYRNETTWKGRLLVAILPSTYTKKGNMTANRDGTKCQINETENQTGNFNETNECDYNSSCVQFQSVVFHDVYNFIWLERRAGNVSVCQKAICCNLEYSMSESGIITNTSGHYALGVFDGEHVHDGSYYLQVCTLLRCANALGSSCGEPVKFSNTFFDFISLIGIFQTPYISPEILVVDSDGNLALPSGGWQYRNGNIRSPKGFPEPLLSVNLFGRWYDKDNVSQSHASALQTRFLPFVILLVFMCMCM